MVKNTVIGFLLIVALFEGVMFYRAKTVSSQTTVATVRKQPPLFLSKGVVLKNSPMASYAYLIDSGPPSAKTIQALNGWDVAKKMLADGSLQITLTAKGSDDVNQQYTVKPGHSLYFIEMTMGDDQGNADLNLRDDYGVIVDQNGIVT
jgi:hypothetical protein